MQAMANPTRGAFNTRRTLRGGVVMMALLPAVLAAQSREDQAPLALPFDWEVATPSSQGVDAKALEEASRRAEAGEFGQVHGLLVARNGKLIFERYYHGWDMHQMHTIQSVTKSVTSMLIGIAIGEGKIKSVDQPIMEFFPEHKDLFTDPRKQKLTLRHVLTMTLGNDWKENAFPYSNPQNIVWRMALAPDWMKFILEQPMVEEPGTRFNYNSGSSLLLSGILQNVTGMNAHAYAEQKLFNPLAIPVYGWYRNFNNPANWSHTGGGLNMRHRDIAKIGQLVVSGGRWKDKQVVPAEWIKESTRAQLHTTPTSNRWYGYQWWLQKLPPESAVEGDPVEVVQGRGWGGQFIMAIPRLNLVAVSTSGSFEDEAVAQKAMGMLMNLIVPAVKTTKTPR